MHPRCAPRGLRRGSALCWAFAAIALALGFAHPPQARAALSTREAIRIAREDPKVAAETPPGGHLKATPAPRDGTGERRIYFGDGGKPVVLVGVDAGTHQIAESWTGYQITWQLTRGDPGFFGRAVNSPWVWLPLCAIFLFGLLDYRRLRRVAHLDLVVILSFGISQLFLGAGHPGVSVPLVYPPLLYLLGRMAWVGYRGRGAGLRPSAPTALLAILAIGLLGGRVALNLADSNVIDVGYASIVGADQVTHGQPIYGVGSTPVDNPYADTYGPALYYAYAPSISPSPGRHPRRAAGRAHGGDRLRRS